MHKLNDLELESALEACVKQERAALAEVLRYLREVEERELFLARGYSSLFAYCTERLGYSEPEAYLRIQAMRLLRAVPEAEEKLQTGQLSLSVAGEIAGAARREKLKAGETALLVQELTGASKREAEKRLAARFPQTPKPEQARPVSKDLLEIRFTLTQEEAALLETLLDERAHSNYSRSYKQLFLDLARKALPKPRQRKAQRPASTPPPSSSQAPEPTPAAPPQAGQPSPEPTPAPAQPTTRGPLPQDAPFLGPGQVIRGSCSGPSGQSLRSRYIPAQVKRAVWQRDEGRCQYHDPLTGHPCHSRHGLELDHIKPYAAGGSHTPENLRLLCGAHNRWRSRQRSYRDGRNRQSYSSGPN